MKKQSNLEREAIFFNNYVSDVDLKNIDISKSFNINSREGKFILKNIPQKLFGKHVLDMGCGKGETSIFFAKRKARVISMDISSSMIKVTTRLAKLHHVNHLVKAMVADIQKLPFKKNQFDIVHGKAVLHHVHLETAVKEVYRMLKPGGIAIFSDPLTYNPFIRLYERYSKELRSEDERRLNLNDLKSIQLIFNNKVDWIGTDIFSLPLFALYFLWLKFTKPKVSPEWFLDIQTGNRLQTLYRVFNSLDDFLPKYFNKYGWRAVIICRK